MDHTEAKHRLDSSFDAVLASGITRTSGDPPAPPKDFMEGYILPEHYTKPLQALHFTPIDKRLKFYEEPHVYTFDDIPLSGSVTYLAHMRQEHFDKLKTIQGMKDNYYQAWPRKAYAKDVTLLDLENSNTVIDISLGIMMTYENVTASVIPPYSLNNGVQICHVKKMLELTSKKVAKGIDTSDPSYYSFTRSLTDEEIMKMWDDNGLEKRNLGTEGHYQAELFLNGLPCRWWEGEMQVLLDFVKEHMIPRKIVAYNTEKEIVCPDADLGGSVDAILWDDANKVYHILDFKRTDKLMSGLRPFKSKKMRAPLDHLDDCDGAGYALQLGIYQFILEREYKMPIGDRILLSIHPEVPACTSVPYLREEVEFIFRERFELVRARKAAALENKQFRCEITGAPLIDAVKLEDGRLVMEKIALVKGLSYTIDKETRTQFESAVSKYKLEVPLPNKANCLPWWRRMPKEGLDPF